MIKLGAKPRTIRYGAKELRLIRPSEEEKKVVKKNPVYIILDNVLDTYNIGAIFRLADAAAASKVYITSQGETPPNHRIKKASINTTEWVDWEYAETAVEAISNIKSQISNVQIVAIEQSDKSVPYDEVEYTFPIALVVGHESDGVSQETMVVCDHIVEIPMWGVNKSLNVMVSLGIVLYEVMEKAVGRIEK